MTREARRLARSPRADLAPGIRVIACPGQPDVAQLVVAYRGCAPSVAEVTAWAAELRGAGVRAIRTGALSDAAAATFERCGFREVQRLALLANDRPEASAATPATKRLLRYHDRAAAAVDLAAFGTEWQLDGEGIAAVRAATPRHRARASSGSLVAYAVSGWDRYHGFLQRLAVLPEAQGRGHGAALVADCLTALARRDVRRVLVNTPVDNERALSLYRRMGFHDLPEHLHVLQMEL